MSGLGGSLAGLTNLNRGINASISRIQAAAKEQEESIRSINYLAEIQKASTAEEFCVRLGSQIKKFDAELDPDHEVGMKLVTFGQAITFHVTGLGFHNPSLIFFYGETPEGDKVQLIQHISQISFVLMAMPKPDPDQPKRPSVSHRHMNLLTKTPPVSWRSIVGAGMIDWGFAGVAFSITLHMQSLERAHAQQPRHGIENPLAFHRWPSLE